MQPVWLSCSISVITTWCFRWCFIKNENYFNYFFCSLLQFGQYHDCLGMHLSPRHFTWNHSMEQFLLSHFSIVFSIAVTPLTFSFSILSWGLWGILLHVLCGIWWYPSVPLCYEFRKNSMCEEFSGLISIASFKNISSLKLRISSSSGLHITKSPYSNYKASSVTAVDKSVHAFSLELSYPDQRPPDRRTSPLMLREKNTQCRNRGT